MNIYKWLWSKIGGRPWTYITRDIWHNLEYLPIFFIFTAGYLLGKYTGWMTLLVVFIAFTIGYIFGHFFWGTSYIPGQKGD